MALSKRMVLSLLDTMTLYMDGIYLGFVLDFGLVSLIIAEEYHSQPTQNFVGNSFWALAQSFGFIGRFKAWHLMEICMLSPLYPFHCMYLRRCQMSLR